MQTPMPLILTKNVLIPSALFDNSVILGIASFVSSELVKSFLFAANVTMDFVGLMSHSFLFGLIHGGHTYIDML